jgi:hypothetical protein
MPHVTEVRSVRCQEISQDYARLAAHLEAVGDPMALRFKQLSAEYAQEARDLIRGQASTLSCVIAMAMHDQAKDAEQQ